MARLALATLPALADRPLRSDVFFSCGPPAQRQAGLSSARVTAGGERFESVRLVGKTTLRMPDNGDTGWGLSYGLSVDRLRGVSWCVDSLGLMAVATRALASGLLGHANLGWNHSRADKQHTTFWSLGIETTSDFTVAADLFGDDRNKPGVSAGAGYLFGGGFSANIGYALLLESPRIRQWTLGAKFAF